MTIDANDLERMAQERPEECFLKGSGVLKLIGGIRQLEAEVRELRATEQESPTWVLVMRPGLVPDRKGPFHTKRLVEDMLRGLYEHYPDCICVVVDMPHTSYPQSGREWIDMYGDRRRKRPAPEANTFHQGMERVDAIVKLLSVDVALNMCREANTVAKLPTPMCWDLALYVQRLEAALGVAPSNGGSDGAA